MGVENEPAGVFPSGSWDNWSGRPRKTSSAGGKEDGNAQSPSKDLSLDRSAQSDDAHPHHTNPHDQPTAMSQNDAADMFSSLYGIESLDCMPMDMSEFLTEWPVSVDDPLQNRGYRTF